MKISIISKASSTKIYGMICWISDLCKTNNKDKSSVFLYITISFKTSIKSCVSFFKSILVLNI